VLESSFASGHTKFAGVGLHPLPWWSKTFAEVQKRQLRGFYLLEDNSINWSWQNVAHKHRPWVYSSIPNLTLISKGGWVQEPHICQNLPKIAVFHPWKVTISRFKWILSCKHRHGSTASCQIWPGSVKGMFTRAPPKNVKIWSKLWHYGSFFALHGQQNTPIQMKLASKHKPLAHCCMRNLAHAASFAASWRCLRFLVVSKILCIFCQCLECHKCEHWILKSINS